MTVRDIYEAVLVEVNKESSQTFTTEEFNYIVNKSILASTNEKYNFYAVNQQLSDDLRTLGKSQLFNVIDTVDIETGDDSDVIFNQITSYVLNDVSALTTIELNTTKDLTVNDIIRFGDDESEYTVIAVDSNTNIITVNTPVSVTNGTEVLLSTDPISVSTDSYSTSRIVEVNFVSSDYLHLTGCRIIWKAKKPSQSTPTHITFPAKRLTYDMLGVIQNNSYLTPAPNRPYYQIFDSKKNSGIVTMSGTSNYGAYQNKPRFKVYIGSSNTSMELRRIEFDYLKLPEKVTLQDSDIYSYGDDPSQILELPDHLFNDIVKRCTMYLLEKASDPRIQTQPQVNQEIPTIPISYQIAKVGQPQVPQQQGQ